jgi:hypothetical protein
VISLCVSGVMRPPSNLLPPPQSCILSLCITLGLAELQRCTRPHLSLVLHTLWPPCITHAVPYRKLHHQVVYPGAAPGPDICSLLCFPPP